MCSTAFVSYYTMKPEDSTIPPSPEPSPPLHDPPPRRNTSFKGDVLRLVSGTGLAQLIAILAAPILTRLYAPEAFGGWALLERLASGYSALDQRRATGGAES